MDVKLSAATLLLVAAVMAWVWYLNSFRGGARRRAVQRAAQALGLTYSPQRPDLAQSSFKDVIGMSGVLPHYRNVLSGRLGQMPAVAQAPTTEANGPGMQLKTWHVFIIVALANLAVAAYFNQFGLTKDVYASLMADKLDSTQVDQYFRFLRKLVIWGYLFAPALHLSEHSRPLFQLLSFVNPFEIAW